MLGQAFWRNKAIKQQMGCSRPIGFQPCNSLWFRANFGLQLSMELHSPRNSLSLRSTISSKSLYGVHFPSTLSYGVRFPPTLSLYGVHLPRKFDRVHLSRTHTLSLFTEYISLQLSPTEYVSLQLFTEYIFLSLSLSLSLFLYGVHFPPTLSTEYVCLQPSLRTIYGVYFPPTLPLRTTSSSNSRRSSYVFLSLSLSLSLSVSLCLRSTFLLGRALDGVRCRPGPGCQ